MDDFLAFLQLQNQKEASAFLLFFDLSIFQLKEEDL